MINQSNADIKGDMKAKRLPTLDNLRNFFLTTTLEVHSFLQHLREAL
jgi:hypothetical protein